MVPVALWTPEENTPYLPLVLLGHGGSQHRSAPGLLRVASRFVDRNGFAAVAIDGPVHGARRADGGQDAMAVFRDAVASWADPAGLEGMTADWLAALEAVVSRRDLGLGPVGYWGLSMGTLYGLPLLAAEPRIAAASLGLWGFDGPARAVAGRLRDASALVTCPLLFLAQESDQLFPIAGVIELFQALGSADRRLHINVGTHGEIPAEEFDRSVDFIVDRLREYHVPTAR